MNAAICLKDEKARVLNKLVATRYQKEVVQENCFTLAKFALGTLKVKGDVEVFQELGDGVPVGVAFLLDDANQIVQHVASSLVCDYRRCQISKNVRARHLDCIQVFFIEQHINNSVSSVGMIEKDKQTPMNQPRPLFECMRCFFFILIVNSFFQGFKVFDSAVPVLTKNLSGELTPKGTEAALGVVGEQAEMGEVQRSGGVEAAVVVELGVLVEQVEAVSENLILLNEVRHDIVLVLEIGRAHV